MSRPHMPERKGSSKRFFSNYSHRWLPSDIENDLTPAGMNNTTQPIGGGGHPLHANAGVLGGSGRNLMLNHLGRKRTWRRRIFLLITEPHTSTGSLIFYLVCVVVILVSNVFEIMQTVESWQFIPTDCVSCGGDVRYFFEDDDHIATMPPESGIECICPPAPLPFSGKVIMILLYFLTAEWGIRVLMFAPADPAPTLIGRIRQFLGFFFSMTTIIDALAIFPYYFNKLPNGLISLRLLRLFRVFQFVKFGRYNAMFTSLTNVLRKLVHYLKLLVLVLAFAAAFFGSMLFWLERGQWKYYEPNDRYMWVRIGVDGVTEEPSPFTSIPNGLWWFMVTASTVGYGDLYPTSTAGRWCGTLSMLTGVLVVAFPVSVFSDLWSQELKRAKEQMLIERARRKTAALILQRGMKQVRDREHDEKNETTTMTNDEEKNQPVVTFKPESPMMAQQEEPSTSSMDLLEPISRRMSGIHFSAIDQRSNNDHHVSDDEMDPEHIVMDRADMREIANCLQAIRTNERRVNRILEKYGMIVDDDNDVVVNNADPA